MPAKQQWPADKIKRRKVAELIPYARNARTHSPEQVAQIAASIKEWGFTNPVLIDETDGIIAGHGRVLAAQLLKLPDVPTMVATGWTEAQKRAYVIADNKISELGEWDRGVLSMEFAQLEGLDFDISLTGFSPDDLKEFDLSFSPNEFPTIGGHVVTGKEIDKTQDRLDGRFEKASEQNLIDVLCPHCGEGFGLNRDAL